MKIYKFFVSFLTTLICIPTLAEVYVEGYHRQDGTYVPPHYRSNPNQTPNDNWSTKPNINPHTLEKGTKNPQPNFYPDNNQYNRNPYQYTQPQTFK